MFGLIVENIEMTVRVILIILMCFSLQCAGILVIPTCFSLQALVLVYCNTFTIGTVPKVIIKFKF